MLFYVVIVMEQSFQLIFGRNNQSFLLNLLLEDLILTGQLLYLHWGTIEGLSNEGFRYHFNKYVVQMLIISETRYSIFFVVIFNWQKGTGCANFEWRTHFSYEYQIYLRMTTWFLLTDEWKVEFLECCLHAFCCLQVNYIVRKHCYMDSLLFW